MPQKLISGDLALRAIKPGDPRKRIADGNGLYLLDEPEAALSPNRQLAALRAIHDLVQDHSQFIIATHSPILLSYPHARIFLFDQAGVSEVAFEDTEHFAVTRDFLNNYPRRLEQLFEPGDEDDQA